MADEDARVRRFEVNPIIVNVSQNVEMLCSTTGVTNLIVHIAQRIKPSYDMMLIVKNGKSVLANPRYVVDTGTSNVKLTIMS